MMSPKRANPARSWSSVTPPDRPPMKSVVLVGSKSAGCAAGGWRAGRRAFNAAVGSVGRTFTSTLSKTAPLCSGSTSEPPAGLRAPAAATHPTGAVPAPRTRWSCLHSSWRWPARRGWGGWTESGRSSRSAPCPAHPPGCTVGVCGACGCGRAGGRAGEGTSGRRVRPAAAAATTAPRRLRGRRTPQQHHTTQHTGQSSQQRKHLKRTKP